MKKQVELPISWRAVIYFFLLWVAIPSWALDVDKTPTVNAYINTISKEYGFDQNQLRNWFSKVDFDEMIIAKMTKPAEDKPWYVYRNIFITPKRIQRGLDFWNANAQALVTAQQRYGVQAEIIVGIIGAETSYGENKGNFSVLNALSTLAFRYPARSRFFTSELTEFLLLCREQGWDPLLIKGSYAGAVGMPQFMPSSYRRYAVDASGDGQKDLFNSNVDTINSVANYLNKKGWKAHKPIVIPATIVSDKYNNLTAQNGKPHFTQQQLSDYGLVPSYPVAKDLPVGVLFLQDLHHTEHWITFTNFAVIKRYNTSSKYAMVVYQLGNKIKAAREKHK